MISLRPSLLISAFLLLGAKLDPAPPEAAAPAIPACPSNGIHGLTVDGHGRRSFYLSSELTEIHGRLVSRHALLDELRIDILEDSRATQEAGLILEVHGGDGARRCTPSNLRRPDRCFDFDVSCDASPGKAGAAQVRSVHWIWLDAHHALTDLLPAPAGLLDPRPVCSSPFEELPMLRDPYLDLLKDPAYPEYPLQEVVELENPPAPAAPLPIGAEGCR
jgi:hypothetical protein